MSDDELSKGLLERLGRLDVLDPPADVRSLQVARMTRVVEASLRRARSERAARRRAWLGAAALAAAGVALILWVRGLGGAATPGASVLAATGAVELRSTRGGSGLELGRAGMTLEPDTELSTAQGSSAEMKLPSGAVVAVEASTRVRLPADARSTLAERLELTEGRISLRVPKLASGHSLSVVTPDATVTVRGTRFSVDVNASPAGSVTSVVVDDGRVEVRSAGRSAWLGAGDTWSSRPAAPSVASASAASEAMGEPERSPPSSAAEAAGRNRPKAASLPPAEQSSLAEENGLLAQALRKARTGNIADALADLERFQREHPRSPLTQAVRVEHFRLLREAGQTERAAREARRYLSDYPNGFARDDAKRTALYGVEGTP